MRSILTLRALFGTLLPLALAPLGCGDLAAWFESQLGEPEIVALRAAQHAAFAALRASLAQPYSCEIQDRAGLPAPAVAIALLDGLAASLVPMPRAA